MLSKLFKHSKINVWFPAILKYVIIFTPSTRAKPPDALAIVNRQIARPLFRKCLHLSWAIPFTFNSLRAAYSLLLSMAFNSSCQLDFLQHFCQAKNWWLSFALIDFEFSKAFNKSSHYMALDKLSAICSHAEVVNMQEEVFLPKYITRGSSKVLFLTICNSQYLFIQFLQMFFLVNLLC